MSTINASTIRATTLQHTNGTTALTIDASGIVLSPNVPAFIVYNNGVSAIVGPTSVITTIEQMSANDTMQVYLNSGSSHGNLNGQFYGYLIG